MPNRLMKGPGESEKPAPAGTGTGEVGSPNHNEEGQPETNRTQPGRSGNPPGGTTLGHSYRPVLWMPQVDLPLVAEIVRCRQAQKCYI